jgi:anti-sigma factor RsiW
MNCDYCKDKLSAFIDNELPSEERLVMEEHFKVCPFCVRELETLRQLGGLFGSIPETLPSSAFVQTTIDRAASIPRNSSWNERFLEPVLSFVKIAATFVFAPEGYSAAGRKNLSSRGYLRTFDDSPPGSFADVYLSVIQEGSH